MDVSIALIIALLSIAVTLLLLRWALSISRIIALLTEQRDLLAKLVINGSAAGHKEKGLPNIRVGTSSSDEENSYLATQLQELRRKYKAGDITEDQYISDANKLTH